MKRRHESATPEAGPAKASASTGSCVASEVKLGANTAQAGPPLLSRSQRALVERNRQRALMLRQARLLEHPSSSAALDDGCGGRVLRVQGSRLVDSGGGFFIDDAADGDSAASALPTVREPPAPLHVSERPECDECGRPVASSFLVDSFDRPVCDGCRKEHADKYALITRTEARHEYILRDADLDRRAPVLRYITRRNPHNPHWGEMRLYLRLQVEKRALEVWGSEEELERQHELRNAKKDKIKVNKLNKRVKELRMAVRSSVYKKDLSGHEHTYGEEVYNEEEDMYTRSCTECDHSQTYEKM